MARNPKPPVPPAPVKTDVPQVVETPEAPLPPAFVPPVHASEVVVEDKKQDLPVAEAAPIVVIAIREGQIYRDRKKVGAEFTIKTMQELGSWMKLKDVKLEKERQRKIKLAKAGR